MYLFILVSFCYSHLILATYNVSDDVLFGISWPGSSIKLETAPVAQSVVMQTADQSSYQCNIPGNIRSKNSPPSSEPYSGPGPLQLVQPLLDQVACSYKIDSYWSYELCFGKHIRQFHEEQQPKENILQEYYLGYFDKESTEKAFAEQKDKKPETITLEGSIFPFLELNYTNGQACDLTGQPRRTRVLVVCQADGRGEIYDIAEVESCQYQMIVISKLICTHPAYMVVKPTVNDIWCVPMESTSPPKPRGLTELEEEALLASQTGASNLQGLFGQTTTIGGQTIQIEASREKGNIVYRIKTTNPQDLISESTEPPPSDTPDVPPPSDTPDVPPTSTASSKASSQKLPPKVEEKKKALEGVKKIPVSAVESQREVMNRFLKGDYCVTGGTGWWRHEVCFKKSIIQFHDDPKTNSRQTVKLGDFQESSHLDWMKMNPTKTASMPPESRSFFWQFYGHGDFCEAIKASRSVIVKIKCREDASTAVTISFQEPSTCQYFITIESSIFCQLVRSTDEFGLREPPSNA